MWVATPSVIRKISLPHPALLPPIGQVVALEVAVIPLREEGILHQVVEEGVAVVPVEVVTEEEGIEKFDPIIRNCRRRNIIG